MDPLVSAIITTYNRATWLEKSLQSCLEQTYLNLEIIVIDDGSNNNSAQQICNRFPRVKYIRQANQGLGGARNTGINQSSGEFIQFLDDDDWLEPSSIANKMEIFSEHKNCGAVYSDLFLAQENGEQSGRYYAKYKRPLPEGQIFDSLMRRNFIPVHALLWKKSVLLKASCFPIRSGAEDWECLVRASEFTEFRFLDQPLGTYRLHSKNMTFNYQRQLSGDAEVQKLIISSQSFFKISKDQKIDLFFHYCLRQWAFGEKKLAISYFESSRCLNSRHPKVLILQGLIILGRPLTRLLLRWFWMLRSLFSGQSADSHFLSRVHI